MYTQPVADPEVSQADRQQQSVSHTHTRSTVHHGCKHSSTQLQQRRQGSLAPRQTHRQPSQPCACCAVLCWPELTCNGMLWLWVSFLTDTVFKAQRVLCCVALCCADLIRPVVLHPCKQAPRLLQAAPPQNHRRPAAAAVVLAAAGSRTTQCRPAGCGCEGAGRHSAGDWQNSGKDRAEGGRAEPLPAPVSRSSHHCSACECCCCGCCAAGCRKAVWFVATLHAATACAPVTHTYTHS